MLIVRLQLNQLLVTFAQGLMHIQVRTIVDELDDHELKHTAELIDAGAIDVELLDKVCNDFVAEGERAQLR